MAQAYEDLAKGDLAQASKMGWEAAEQIVRAVADDRGWECDDFWSLLRASDNLYCGASDPESAGQFSSALLLHTNFNEFGNAYSSRFIEGCLEDVARFVNWAEGLLEGPRAGSREPV